MLHTLYYCQPTVVLNSFYLKSILQALADHNVTYLPINPPILTAVCDSPLTSTYDLKVFLNSYKHPINSNFFRNFIHYYVHMI
jgi:hypothetical protein